MNPAAIPFLHESRRETPRRARPATVVLLHSSAGSARQWQALTEALQSQWRVLTPEFHGHGTRAEWHDATPMTLADDAAQAAEMLAAAGGGWVVGHSYGGAVALMLASRHPERVHGVVAYEPVLFPLLAGDPDTAQEWQEAVAVADDIRKHLARGADEAAARGFVDYWSGRGTFDHLPPGTRAATVLRMPSVMRQYETLTHEPALLSQLTRLRQPMLVLTGERTVRPLRRIAEILRAGVPQARHQTLAGMGHMGPLTHAEGVNRQVLRFMASHAAAVPAACPAGTASAPRPAFPSHVATTSTPPVPSAPPTVLACP